MAEREALRRAPPAPDGGYSILDSGDPCKYAATTIQNSTSNIDASKLSYTITYTTAKTSAVTTTTGPALRAPHAPICPMSQGDSVEIQAVYPVTPVMFGWTSKTYSLTGTKCRAGAKSGSAEGRDIALRLNRKRPGHWAEGGGKTMREARKDQGTDQEIAIAGNARQRRNCRSIARLILADESGQ